MHSFPLTIQGFFPLLLSSCHHRTKECITQRRMARKQLTDWEVEEKRKRYWSKCVMKVSMRNHYDSHPAITIHFYPFLPHRLFQSIWKSCCRKAAVFVYSRFPCVCEMLPLVASHSRVRRQRENEWMNEKKIFIITPFFIPFLLWDFLLDSRRMQTGLRRKQSEKEIRSHADVPWCILCASPCVNSLSPLFCMFLH